VDHELVFGVSEVENRVGLALVQPSLRLERVRLVEHGLVVVARLCAVGAA